MTFAELRCAIERLTPVQLASHVMWVGDDRGGFIERLEITDEDALQDVGDSGEVFTRSDLEASCADDPDGAARLADAQIVHAKGFPILITDGT